MESPIIGFAVLYRWRVREDMEAEFLEAWETVTLGLKEHRGALGSRLHRVENDLWAAYAQWPSREAWARSREMPSVDPAASAVMAKAILESRDPILMTPHCDHLVPSGSLGRPDSPGPSDNSAP